MSQSLFFPSMVFSTLSFWAVCWLDVFFGVWKLWPGALQGLWSSLADPVLVYLSFICPVSFHVFLSLCTHLTICITKPLLDVFVFTGCWSGFGLVCFVFICCKSVATFLELLFCAKVTKNRTYFLDISLHPLHSSLVWKQEGALFEQYYSCPLWLWSLFGHRSVPLSVDSAEKGLPQSS